MIFKFKKIFVFILLKNKVDNEREHRVRLVIVAAYTTQYNWKLN